MAKSKLTLEERFWSKVSIPEDPAEECWLWMGSLLGVGYGSITAFNKEDRAHRVSWMLHHNTDRIPEGMVVCHKCDVRACVSPYHLFLGTQGDNMRDMVKKGRHRTGPRFKCRKCGHVN